MHSRSNHPAKLGTPTPSEFPLSRACVRLVTHQSLEPNLSHNQTFQLENRRQSRGMRKRESREFEDRTLFVTSLRFSAVRAKRFRIELSVYQPSDYDCVFLRVLRRSTAFVFSFCTSTARNCRKSTHAALLRYLASFDRMLTRGRVEASLSMGTITERERGGREEGRKMNFRFAIEPNDVAAVVRQESRTSI